MTKIWSWAESDLYRLLKTCERDGLLPLIEKYLPAGTLVLESGCGAGRYVKFLSERSRSTIGLEWSSATLRMVKRYWPELKLVQGDVAASPFTNECFDGVLSLGVVEHWEEGPSLPLREIVRTLKPGGVAIVSVPLLSTIRRIKRRVWWPEIVGLPRAIGKWLIKGERPRLTRLRRELLYAVYPAWGEFFEYRMKKNEFAQELMSLGLEVLEHRPLGEMDGFYHELNPLKLFVGFEGWEFHPSRIAAYLNTFLGRYAFFHPHMQVAVVRKLK